MMKPEAFVENIMLRGLVRDLADALERELRHRYKNAKSYKHLQDMLDDELGLVKKARNRLNEP